MMTLPTCWVSETERLPIIGQRVLVAVPRQAGEFWDIQVMALLARHEGVAPQPVQRGARWPTDYYWGSGRTSDHTTLITGHGWWAPLTSLTLPPFAEHKSISGYDCVVQTGPAFTPMR